MVYHLFYTYHINMCRYLWIDKRDNWHVINHAYDTRQLDNCAHSILSTHFFSEDGKEWQCADDEPYGHTVHFDDGTTHTYTTLERPNIHFDTAGQMTHLGLAADLVTEDEGCANRTWRRGAWPHSVKCQLSAVSCNLVRRGSCQLQSCGRHANAQMTS